MAADVQAIAINDVVLIALPVEPFTRTGMKIREVVGETTVVAGYANGTVAYCPLPEDYPEGGYGSSAATAFTVCHHPSRQTRPHS